MIIKECPCGAEIHTTKARIKDGRGKFCSKKCMYKHKTPIVLELNITCPCGKKFHAEPNQLKRGCGKYCSKGCMYRYVKWSPNSGSFLKGQKPWNKGKEFKQMQGDKHHNYVNGRTSYAAMVKRLGFEPKCTQCGKEGEFGKKMPIHHIDFNRNNNDIENLLILCSKCHANIHRPWEKRRWNK